MTDPRDWLVRAINNGTILIACGVVILACIAVLIYCIAARASQSTDDCVPFVIQRSQDVMITNNYSQCASVVTIDHSRHVVITGNYYRTAVK